MALSLASVSPGEIITDASFRRLYNSDQLGAGEFELLQALNVGTKANAKGWDLHAGYAFQMTRGGAESLLAADFSVSLTALKGTPLYHVDVYVNRVAPTADFLVSDFEKGTKLMDDFVTTKSAVVATHYSLDSAGQANLLTYLQNNWVPGEYVFITLKANTDDALPTPFVMGQDADANYIFGGGPAFSAEATDAQLTITRAVPEPSSLALLDIGEALQVAGRRRSGQ